MKKFPVFLLLLSIINISNAIDINIPIIDKKITPLEGFEPGEVLKWAGRLTDQTINAIKENITKATDQLQFWKEEVKKQEKSVPVDVPYNYNELLSVDNQDIFTQIVGKANQISVGKNKDKMSVWMIGPDQIPYEYNPSNKTHNLSWIKQRKNSGIKKIAVAEDGTIAGIDQNGNIVISKNNKWTPIKATRDSKAIKMTAQAAENLKAIDLDIADKNELIYLSTDGKVYKSNDGGMDWKTLPTLKNKEKFQNVSIGADGTIVACTNNLTAYYFDGKNWTTLPGKVKKVAAGSKTNLVGISDKNELVVFDPNKNTWEIQENSIANAADRDKPIKVIDVATNSSDNIWAIKSNGSIITNIAANTSKALQKLKPGKIVTINSLSENKYLQVIRKEGSYLKPVGTDPENSKNQFTIIRSGQYVGFQQNNQFVSCDPNEGLGEFKGSIKLSSNFLSGEKWLISGELEQAIINSYINKKNLATIPLEQIILILKEEQMKQIQEHHDYWQATVGTIGVIGSYIATNTTFLIVGPFSAIGWAQIVSISLIAVTAVEFQRQRTVAELEDYTNPVLQNPGLLGPMIVMDYLPPIFKGEEENLSTLFDIEIQTEKEKDVLATDEKDFKQEYQFEIPGNGYIKFKVTGYPLNFWLWDKNKKEIILPGIIGGQNNTTISIGTPTGWQPISKKDEIIKPDISNSFWIEIKDNKLTIGSGDLIGLNKLGESKKLDNLDQVKYVTFSKLPTSDVNLSEVKFYNKLLEEKKEQPSKTVKEVKTTKKIPTTSEKKETITDVKKKEISITQEEKYTGI